MKTRVLLALLAALTLTAACSWEGVQEQNKTNSPPIVRITGGASEGADADYRVEFNWSGSDQDGTIDHFLYAIDDTCLCSYTELVEVIDPDTGDPEWVEVVVNPTVPDSCLAHGIEPAYADVDSIWRRTQRFSGSFAFSAEEETTPGSPATGSAFHTFFIKAVDNRGAESSVDHRTFNATTILPTVRILRPVGSSDTKFAPVSGFLAVVWTGRDEDAVDASKKPVGYQMKLVTLDNQLTEDATIRNYLAHTLGATGWSTTRRDNLLIPDSLRAEEAYEEGVPFPPLPTEEHYYRTDWWPKVDQPHTEERLQLRSLPQGNYALAVRAIDQAGAFMPNEILVNTLEFVTANDNGDALKLEVSPRPVLPYVTITERNFLGSHFFNARGKEWKVEVPTNVDLDFEWVMDTFWYGSANGNFNFALDIADPECEVCQSTNGIGGWIGWGSTNKFKIRFTEQDAGRRHVLYVRARDESDSPEREALCLVIMDVVAFSFDKTALLIDDFKMSGVDDCVHDAIIEPVVQHAIEPHLEIGESLERFNRGRIGACGESATPRELFLSVMSRYKLLYWNVGNAGSGTTLGFVTDPSTLAEFGKYLSIYCRAGGRLIVWGRFPVEALLGDLALDEVAYNPELPIFSNPNWGPGTFLWDILQLRSQFDSVGRSVIQPLSIPCSGFVGMQATAKAITNGYPVGIVDPTGYSDRTAVWWAKWDETGGRLSPNGVPGAEVMTGVPPLRVAGLDTLYTYISNSWAWREAYLNPDYDPNDPACQDDPTLPQCQEWLSGVQTVCGQEFGSPFENEPYVLRLDDPTAPQQGRIAFVSGPLYYLADGPNDTQGMGDLKTLMRGLTDWVFEAGP
jgi:hypothetical protein